MFDGLQQCRVRPLDVVQHHHESLPSGQVLDELAEPPCELLLWEGLCGKPHGGRHPCRDHVRFLRAPAERSELLECDFPRLALRDAGGLADRLRERPVGDPFPVGKAPALSDAGTSADPREELGDEPGLSDAGLAGDRREHASPLAAGPLEGVHQRLKLRASPDHRGVEVLGEDARRANSDQPVRGQRLGFALGRQRFDRLHLHCFPSEPVRGLADEHLAGMRRLLQASGRVHGVARHKPLLGSGIAGDHFPGMDPRPVRETHAPSVLQLDVQRGQSVLHVGCRPYGPKRVVLVSPGKPEDGHHGIPDVLLHDSTVPLQTDPHLFEVAIKGLPEGLRVETLPKRRRSCEVGEHDRDGPAGPLSHRRNERGRAGHAEAGAIGVVLAAVGAGRHRTSVGS